MGRPKKNIEKLDDNVVTEDSKTIEDVIPEVVTDIGAVASDQSKEVEELKRQLADKDMQLEVLGSLTKRQVRGKIKKESKGTISTIKIYDMKGE